MKWLRFVRGENSVGYKYDISADNFKYMNVNDKNMSWESINISKKYNEQYPVSLAKKRDLMNSETYFYEKCVIYVSVVTRDLSFI